MQHLYNILVDFTQNGTTLIGKILLHIFLFFKITPTKNIVIREKRWASKNTKAMQLLLHDRVFDSAVVTIRTDSGRRIVLSEIGDDPPKTKTKC